MINTKADMVTDISVITEFGALGPLTESGTIIVNNVSTSCCEYHHTSAILRFRFFQTPPTRTILLTLPCCPHAGGRRSSLTMRKTSVS